MTRFTVGDRVQLHGFDGCPPGPRRTGFVGTVRGHVGGSMLYGLTDQGGPWFESSGALVPAGQPDPSAACCNCCPRPT